MRLIRPGKTRFRSGSGYLYLSLATYRYSPVRSPISTPSHKTYASCSDSLEAHGFRFSFTPLAGVLFTCPSRYSFTIGHLEYLALDGGPPCFQRNSTCSAVLSVTSTSQCLFTYGTLTLSGRPFQQRSAQTLVSYSSTGLLSSPDGRQPP
jgi:hypothetical protein